jgi:undecaprenyl-diphosphatase
MNKRKILLIIIPVTLFALLAVSITAGLTHGFENWAYRETAEEISASRTPIMLFITHLGSTYAVTGFCLLLIVIPKARKTIAFPVSVAVILSFVLNISLKVLFSRERPDVLRFVDETSYSFPSGHAMINASLYTMLALLALKFIKHFPKKVALVSLCAFLAVGIGFTRLYLGAHYAGDILGGWMLGFAVSMFVYSNWSRRLRRAALSG